MAHFEFPRPSHHPEQPNEPTGQPAIPADAPVSGPPDGELSVARRGNDAPKTEEPAQPPRALDRFSPAARAVIGASLRKPETSDVTAEPSVDHTAEAIDPSPEPAAAAETAVEEQVAPVLPAADEPREPGSGAEAIVPEQYKEDAALPDEAGEVATDEPHDEGEATVMLTLPPDLLKPIELVAPPLFEGTLGDLLHGLDKELLFSPDPAVRAAETTARLERAFERASTTPRSQEPPLAYAGDLVDALEAAYSEPDVVIPDTPETAVHLLDPNDFRPDSEASLLRRDGIEAMTIYGDDITLNICSGERFTNALSRIPEDTASPILRSGLNALMRRTTIIMASDGYHRWRDDVEQAQRWEDGTVYEDPDELLPDPAYTSDVPELDIPYERPRSVDEVLKHAEPLAEQLDRLGADPMHGEDLRRAREANDEGHFAEWAAAKWHGLYNPPSTELNEHAWTGWTTPEQWRPTLETIESTVALTPNSRFVPRLAQTLLDNVGRLRRGDLVPGSDFDYRSPRWVHTYEPIVTEDNASAADTARYNQTLDEVEARLRRLL